MYQGQTAEHHRNAEQGPHDIHDVRPWNMSIVTDEEQTHHGYIHKLNIAEHLVHAKL